MTTYRIHYLADHDDADPRHYRTEFSVKAGDVLRLPETGNYHRAIRLHTQKTGVRIDLSKSAQSPAEAILLSVQLGHWPAD